MSKRPSSYFGSLGIKSPRDMSYGFCETLRQNEIVFPSETHHRTISNPTVPSKALSNRILELENTKKYYASKVLSLEVTIKELNERLRHMHEVNKKLLNEKLRLGNGDMHFLVQELLLSDMKQELNQSELKIGHYRVETEKYKKLLSTSLNENKNLKRSIKRYREFVSKPRQQSRVSPDGYTQHLPVCLPDVRKPFLDSVKVASKSKTKRFNLKTLYTSLSDLFLLLDLKQILSVLSNTLKKCILCDSCTMFVVSPEYQDKYANCFESYHHINRITVNNTWILVFNETVGDYREPVFYQLEDGYKGKVKPEYLLLPLKIGNKCPIIVQVMRSTAPSFSENDEFLSKLILSIGGLTIKSFMSIESKKETGRKITELVQITCQISQARNHYMISNTIDKILPEFLGFEGAGMVFYNSDSNEFYLNGFAAASTDKYAADIIKFPAYVGITSEVLSLKSSKAYSNLKDNPLFNEALDNIAGVHNINNAVMSCVYGTNNKIVGILQLGNRKGKSIGNADLKLIQQVTVIIGSIISSINDSAEAMNLTINLKKISERMKETVNSGIDKYGSLATDLGDQLGVLLSKVNLWTHNNH